MNIPELLYLYVEQGPTQCLAKELKIPRSKNSPPYCMSQFRESRGMRVVFRFHRSQANVPRSDLAHALLEAETPYPTFGRGDY